MPDTDARDFGLRFEALDDVHASPPFCAAANDHGGPRGPSGGPTLQDTGTGLLAANGDPRDGLATPLARRRAVDRNAVTVTAIISAAVTVVLIAAMALL